MDNGKIIVWYEKLLQLHLKVLNPLHRDVKTGNIHLKKL